MVQTFYKKYRLCLDTLQTSEKGNSWGFYSDERESIEKITNKELLVDIYAFGKIIPRGEIVSIPLEMWNDWNLQTYSVRYNYISIEAISDVHHRYFFIRKNLPKTLVPNSYEPYPIETKYLDLYILKKQSDNK